MEMHKIDIDELSWFKSAELRELMHVLGDARFVGGCVRNAIMGIEGGDVDIATPHLPEEVVGILTEHGIKTIPTGIDHGTVTAVMKNQSYEITTLRIDTDTDGRHATVQFTSDWEKDAARRDFTMNALSMDMHGNVYDYFSGVEDIHRKEIRFVGDSRERMKEDYLRILRLFRFQAWYTPSSPLDTHTIIRVANNAHGLEKISGERIQKEILKMLEAPNPSWAAADMKSSGVARILFVSKGFHWLTTPLDELLEVEKLLEYEPDPIVRLVTMTYNNTSWYVDQLSRFLKLSNDQKIRIARIVEHQDTEYLWKHMNRNHIHSILYRFGAQATKDLFTIHTTRAWQDPSFMKDIEIIKWAISVWRKPKFPLTGEDIMSLGIKQGPALGQIYKDIERWWVQQHFPGRDAVLNRLNLVLSGKVW